MAICSSCAQNGDCGAGGHCLHVPTYTQGFCSPACPTDGSSCAAGFCTSLGGTVTGCYPGMGECYSGGGSSGATCGTDTWANYAGDFLSNSCEGCHGWAGLQLSVASQATEVIPLLSAGHNAPDGGYPTADVTRITTWLNCGAP